jgi:hypothetical protein
MPPNRSMLGSTSIGRAILGDLAATGEAPLPPKAYPSCADRLHIHVSACLSLMR